jgi:hypothetical protein
MKLTTALARALQVNPPRTVTELVRVFRDNAQAAAILSGATDKKSLAYKAQIRNLQRYKNKTRTPKPSTLKRLQTIVVRRTRRLKSDGAQVEICAEPICVSQDCRDRCVNGKLTGAAMDDFLDVWDRDRDVAAEVFAESFGQENMGGAVPYFPNGVTVLTIQNTRWFTQEPGAFQRRPKGRRR